MTSNEACPPIRVLLVEDDEDDYLLTRDCLRGLGPKRMELEWVASCDAALEALGSGRHDVCLLDYQLGPVTGLELLRQARERGWRGPTLLLTGQVGEDVDQEAQEAGAADFLEKSQLTPTLLGRAIRYALQNARALEALRRSQESFREVIERLPECIAVQDGDRIAYANAALTSLLGYSSAEQLVGQSISVLSPTLLTDEERAALRGDVHKALSTSQPMPPREVRIPRSKGGPATVALSLVHVVFEGRRCLLWSARDLTESKRLQSQLLHADRMASLGVLSAGVAHEINNPLAFTLSNLDHLEKSVLPRLGLSAQAQHEVRELVADARVGTTRVRDIVRQLRIFSRVDQDTRPQPVDVHEVMEMAIRMAATEFKHRARLVRDYGGVLLAEADPGRLGQVLLNLIVNAAHAIPEGSAERQEIRLVTRPHVSGVRIEVRDTGVGIPEEHLERIFEPFFTTKPVGVGTGLGLSICHGIVTGFGGRMGVESRVGQGSTFWLTLNAATSTRLSEGRALSAEAPATSGGRAHQRGRILVVDDEPMIGMAIRRTLQREHEVVTLTSAREACTRLLGGERFDIVLSDVMMPEMSGVELHRELSRLSPELAARMVFLTGGAFTPYARSFLSEVENPRLEKPFSSEELRGLVQALLTQAS